MFRKIILLLISINVAIASYADTDRKIEAQLGNIEIARNVIKELDRREIDYDVTGDLRIMIAVSMAKEVLDIIEGETNKLLPSGRHECFAEDLNVKLKEQLDAEGLQYKFVTYMEWDCIVWDQDDTTKIRRIIEGVVNDWKW